MRDFIEEYVESINLCLRNIPQDNIEKIADTLLAAYKRQARIFIAGNGGSASTASHFACDLAKTTLGSNPMQKEDRFRAIALSDNIALLTAWANDEGYEHVFSEQMKNLAQEGDVLLVISASGNSPNIIKAMEAAGSMKLHTIGLLGFGGGKAKSLAEASIVIESHDYGYVEGAHAVLGHMITSWLRKRAGSQEVA
jgi:D-sedoheptulose 7-phosphate isomerase